MKKIKWTIMTFAILLSIGGAFASGHTRYQNLYYFNGSQYLLAGTEGEDFICESSTQTCTYTYANGVYTPYQIDATYNPVPGKAK